MDIRKCAAEAIGTFCLTFGLQKEGVSLAALLEPPGYRSVVCRAGFDDRSLRSR